MIGDNRKSKKKNQLNFFTLPHRRRLGLGEEPKRRGCFCCESDQDSEYNNDREREFELKPDSLSPPLFVLLLSEINEGICLNVRFLG
jgi:hypothetical protein